MRKIFSFKKKGILNKKSDFNNFIDSNNVVYGKYYKIKYIKSNLDYCRIGIIASKRIGNAIKRNYEKRIVKEFFRKNKKNLKINIDLIVIIKNNYGNFLDKKADFINLTQRIR